MSLLVPKLISSQSVYEGNRFKVKVDALDFCEERPIIKECIVHPGAVVILPISDDGSITFIKQYRHAVGEITLELPAGTREVEESPLDTAKRELSEEVHLGASEWESMGLLYALPGLSNEIQYAFIAKGLFPCYKQADPGEYTEVTRMTLDEVKKLISEDVIVDSKTISTLCKAMCKGFI